MIPLAEARARVLASLRPTGPEIVPLSQGWGRVTATPVVARLTQPPRDMSAMDGYAVRAAETGAGVELTVVGMAPAGHPWAGRLGPGEALRLFTGSVMPQGADSVVPQEDARREGDRVVLTEAVTAPRHVRRAGQDFAAGDTLLPAGHLLSARDIGLAAAGNHAWLAVHRRPRVGILATGDEIALPGDPLADGGIVSSNTHMLAAMIRAGGGEPCLLPIASDDHVALAAALDAATRFDLLLTSGGASVGDHDLVRETLLARGALDFWQVAMRPGKPLMLGVLAGCPVLGLPGNPVSAMVTALLFALPAVTRLSGLPGDPPPTQPAMLAAPLRANDARADHLRAALHMDADGRLQVTPFVTQDSGQLRLLARADALVLRPPHAPAAVVGDTVPVLRLDHLGL